MKTIFGLYGSGWRAEFFLRIAKYCPERFEVRGLVTRNDEKAARFSREFGVPCYGTVDELLAVAKDIQFVVVCVSASVNVSVSLDLLNKGVPVLLETPPATNLESLLEFHSFLPKGAKIQVAEQYPFQPMHEARLKMIESGKLGNIQHTQISYSHGYHAVALIRRYLGVGFENAEIFGTSFPLSVVGGYTRDCEPQKETILQKSQTIAVLKFDSGKTGLLNFETDQHRSWVRSFIIQVKGDRGEIFNGNIKYLQNFNTPMESEFARKDMGVEDNFEGFDLKGITAAGEWLYRNPYVGARLTDDEIAIAACMDKMADYVRGGASFYGLDEASQDLYLGILVEQAVQSGGAVTSQTQVWG